MRVGVSEGIKVRSRVEMFLLHNKGLTRVRDGLLTLYRREVVTPNGQ